ncbi:protein kinase [Actinomadura bangladeshensis]|uniref:Protein kinase n=2 Tax=Actinomadura bangladeshensis TaxID=453573 RepID=A0A6L9QC14_9ACTN|nr:protein kinase [Actinomadura bangladeshensis]
MGQVWRAEDLKLERVVAVKMILSSLIDDERTRDDASARFRREGKAIARLRHPNIPVIYDLGVHRERNEEEEGGIAPYIVMEYFNGRDLRKVIDGHVLGLPIRQAIDYAAQISDALAAAHASGIVHRDIKPANIMITADGIRVLDFGIASFQGATAGLVPTGKGLGTLAYMPYEQANGRTTDPRSDLYALGATLYHALVGHEVFRSVNLQHLAHVNALPELPSFHRSDVPPELDHLVLRLLNRDINKRPSRASEVHDELRALSAAEADRRYMEAGHANREVLQHYPKRRTITDREAAQLPASTKRERDEIINTAKRQADEMRAQAQRILEESEERHSAAQVATQKLVAEAEQRAMSAEQRAMKAIQQAEQTRREADLYAKQLLAETKAEADRVQAAAQRQVDELTRQRESITSHLKQLRQLISGAALDRKLQDNKSAKEEDWWKE